MQLMNTRNTKQVKSPKETKLKRKLNIKSNNLVKLNKRRNNIIFRKYYKDIMLDRFEHSNNIRNFSPFNKQWKNSVYFFNKNHLSIACIKQQIANNFIQTYLDIVPHDKNKVGRSKRMRDYLRRQSINNVFISNSEIKQTNDELYATLYVYDRRKYHYLKKLFFSNKNIKNIIYNTTHSKMDKVKTLTKNSLLFNKSNINYSRYSYKYNNVKNITKKTDLILKQNNKLLLRKRSNLIRKTFLKQLKFNQVKFFNMKKNIINNFVKEFSTRFWILFSKYLNINLTIIKGKLVLTWPRKYILIKPEHYKLNLENKSILENLNISNIGHFISNSLVNYKLFNMFNIIPIENTKKIIINTKTIGSSYTNLLNKFNKVNIVNKSNKSNITSYLLISKIKLINFLIINLIKRLIFINLTRLFGSQFTKIAMFTIWKHQFNNYYDNLLSATIKKEIIKLNRLMFNKDFFNLRGRINVSIIKNILGYFYDKKILLNIVNTKYLHLSSDNYIEAIKVKLKKRKSKLLRVLRKSLKLVKLPKISNLWINPWSEDNLITQTNLKRNPVNKILYNSTRYNNKNYISNGSVSNEILNMIKYKFATGVRLEAKGRLTKRYTASRALFKYKYKGNLKNLEFSRKHPNNIKISPNMAMIRGYNKPNIQYTYTNGIRRIGVFGIRGWISGN